MNNLYNTCQRVVLRKDERAGGIDTSGGKALITAERLRGRNFQTLHIQKRSSSSPNLRWSIVRPPAPGLEAGRTDCSRYTRPNSDHIDRGTLRLDQVKMVVLDEADEMLDMGFRDDIEQVLETVPTERQFICFSATMAKAIMDLINRSSRDPKTIRIDHKVLTVPTVEQACYEIRGRSKTEALTRLIDLHDLKLGIIFCNTKRMVDDLTDELMARGYSAERIHGDMSQAQRELVMTKFRNSGLEFLVATDV